MIKSEQERVDCLQALVHGRAHEVAVIAAHPDDEIIGAGARLRHWEKPQIILVTDGSPPDAKDARTAGCNDAREYAAIRLRESLSALALTGVKDSQVHPFGFQDQCASFKLVEIAWRLAELFFQFRLKMVVTHPYEGGHPDHDSVAFATWAARWISEIRTGYSPAILEMTSYHNRNGSMQTGHFLPGLPDEQVMTTKWSAEDRLLKKRLFSCFHTQREVLPYFAVQPERFRRAPRYDFNKPPHSGRLYYELFNWGMTGCEWRRLARDARTKIMRDLRKGVPGTSLLSASAPIAG